MPEEEASPRGDEEAPPPAGAAVPVEDGTLNRSVRRPTRMVEEFLGMFLPGSTGRDPLAEKLTPAHIVTLLKIAEQQEKHDFELGKLDREQHGQLFRLIVLLAVVALCLAFGLCWLFLAYGKGEQVSQIITVLLAGGGGVGIGTGLKRLTQQGPGQADGAK